MQYRYLGVCHSPCRYESEPPKPWMVIGIQGFKVQVHRKWGWRVGVRSVGILDIVGALSERGSVEAAVLVQKYTVQ